MIMKVVVCDRDRKSAINKMISTLGEVVIDGLTTNLDFMYELLHEADYRNGRIDTGYIERHNL